MSLPSRGAWIEIPPNSYRLATPTVAPLAGSVDRNRSAMLQASEYTASLPSRGAWIEMFQALRLKEGEKGRSPRGERG